MSTPFTIIVHPDHYAVCQLSNIPSIDDTHFHSVAVTQDEISCVCREVVMPDNTIQTEKGWRLMQIKGVLHFAAIGILSKISFIMAQAKVSIYVISTYNTDYVLVKDTFLDTALLALSRYDYKIEMASS